MALYGGFAGTETSSADRNPAANVTILTGDLAKDDPHVNGVTVSADLISGDNSLRVVKAPSGCGLTTVLDGFTITAGDNNSDNGGGMSIESSSPTVTNCAFSGNRTSERGGGVATSLSGAVFEDCRFSGNSATYGGGMYGKGSDLTLRRCAFLENYASDSGGGIALVDGSAAAVSDCTFTGNTADNCGGGLFNTEASNPTVTDCMFSGNAAFVGGGMFNENSDPTVTNCTFSGNDADAGGGSGGGM